MAGSTKGESLPDDVVEALEATPEAYAAFLVMPPAQRRQYLEYIDEVKSPATRARRIVRALEMMTDWNRGHEAVPSLTGESRKVTVRERRNRPAPQPAAQPAPARKRSDDAAKTTAEIPRRRTRPE